MTTHQPKEESCMLSAEEREWVHTAFKYVDSRKLPLAGKLLNMFDDTATLIGRYVLMGVIVGSSALVIWWIAKGIK